MKREEPVEVIRGHGKHRVDTHVFARKIQESFCAQPGCRFRGKRAAQGHCHTRAPFLEGIQWKYIDALEKQGATYIKELRKMSKNHREYVRVLEAYATSSWLNSIFSLDELIRLRAENARLRLRVRKYH